MFLHAHTHTHSGAQLPAVLGVLLDRLRNEITRLTAVRAFGAIATSPLHVDLAGGREMEGRMLRVGSAAGCVARGRGCVHGKTAG